MTRASTAAFCVACAFLAVVAAVSAQDGSLRVGYAIVTHNEPGATTDDLAVFETFGQQQGSDTMQAGVLPAQMTTEAVLFVNASQNLERNLGVAIVNLNSAPVNVAVTLRETDGSAISTRTVSIPGRGQTAQFVNQLFADRNEIQEFSGSLLISSPAPIAVVGLRFRGANFSTIPVVNVSPAAPVPQVAPGVGGPGAFLLPQFAAGGGWASEIIVLNYGSVVHQVRIDLFNQDGTPMTTNVNGETGSTFVFDVSPGGTLIVSPRDQAGNSPF
jgi:hypothetical protein